VLSGATTYDTLGQMYDGLTGSVFQLTLYQNTGIYMGSMIVMVVYKSYPPTFTTISANNGNSGFSVSEIIPNFVFGVRITINNTNGFKYTVQQLI
jgi:hypothetical protein